MPIKYDPAGNYSVSEYFGGKDTKGYKKYKEGKAQGKWKDLRDYISRKGDTESPEHKSAQEIIDASKKAIEEQTSFLDKYVKKNPFIFDEELARQSAKAEYEPYYQELLSDYLGQVELNRETIEDDKKLQAELQEYETGKSSRDFAKAVSQVEQGFAGKGMFFSGSRAKGVGEKEVENVASTEAREAGYESERSKLDRRSRALDIDVSTKERDIGREQDEAIEGGVLQRRGEKIKAYNVPLTQTYQRRFPSSGQSALAGYLVPDYLRY